MSDTQLINFCEKKRELIIKKVLKCNTLPPEAVASMFELHDFLTFIEECVRGGDIAGENLIEVEAEIGPIREKFDELFEMIKKELII